MKKSRKIFLTSILVVGLLTMTFSLASAMADPSNGLADPMVTPAFSGEQYSAKVVAPPDLPGTFMDSSLIYPIGFGPSQGQFSGSGIMVSGLKVGETVNLSFDYKFYNYKWVGSVYSWNGTKWVRLATSVVVSAGNEGMTWATVSGVGNGTYALIIGNYGLPDSKDSTEVPPSEG